MGQSRRRTGTDGKPRYTAYYEDIRGIRRSAGTFSSKKAADAAWHTAETKVGEGRMGDPARGRQTFRRYVEEEWLPHHVMELNTREGYTYSIYKHTMDTFGPMRMIEIMPAHVREWVSDLIHAGVSPATIRLNKTILSAIFTTALNDQITSLHPCKGVKTPPIPPKPLRIVTPEEFDTFHSCLPDDQSRLLVETGIESGLRWGELAELRRKDIDIRSRILTVSRVVIEVSKKFHPEGGRFIVKLYPKSRKWRRLRLSPDITAKLARHIKDNHLGPDDLLFTYRPVGRPTVERRPPEELGLTEPNDKGRRYRHGTLSGYSGGHCRCPHCRGAYADYRRTRRNGGLDNPRPPRRWDTDGHIPARWFRESVFKPALVASELDIELGMHGLRHAHASWLLAGGADLQVVKERLGHGSIATTEKYLHTLPDADDTAIDALDKIRKRA